jgi:hypothetical protein
MNRLWAGLPKGMTSFPEATRHPFPETSGPSLASVQLPIRWYSEIFYVVTWTEAMINHRTYIIPLLQ